MTTVQDTSNVSSLFGASASASTKTSSEETTDRFLSLLVAQMKNQDPLNPLDNAQVTSQMAQLSTVQGIENMNSTLQALASSMGVNQMSQAASLIDASGALVRKLDLGPRDVGVNVLAWDGLNSRGEAVADGEYHFSIDATQGGLAVSSTTLNLGLVNSVSQNSQGVQLNLADNKSTSYADIRQIF